MRKETYIVTTYNREDCEALDRMNKAEVTDLLEGSWLPRRPGTYYTLMNGGEEEVEMDFDLLRSCKAIDLAIKWLREGLK